MRCSWAEGPGDAKSRVYIPGLRRHAARQVARCRVRREVIARSVPSSPRFRRRMSQSASGGDAKIISSTMASSSAWTAHAGGTGAFIDQIFPLMETDAGTEQACQGATHIHRIASSAASSRIDVQKPLINEGAAREDVAASIFQAVANQTVRRRLPADTDPWLCCQPGRPAPVSLRAERFYMPRSAAMRSTGSSPRTHTSLVLPAQRSCGQSADAVTFGKVIDKLSSLGDTRARRSHVSTALQDGGLPGVPCRRHAWVAAEGHARYEGRVFVGLDAGSTTMKAAVVGEDGEHLRGADNSSGDVLGTARKIMDGIDHLPEGCTIGHVDDRLRARTS